MSKTIEFLLHIHTLPEDLAKVLNSPEEQLWSTAQLYLRVIESKFLWKVWQVDEYGEFWVEVNSINEDGCPKFETLKIDSGTYDKVSSEPYEMLAET